MLFLPDRERRAFVLRASLTVLLLLVVIPSARPSAAEQKICAYCGRAIGGDYVTHASQAYHSRCWVDHAAPRCALCGEVLSGEILTDGWGNRYHASHENAFEKCEYCGRFIAPNVTGGGVRYRDGRSICAFCRRTAVQDPGAARALAKEVAGRLATVGLPVDLGRVRLSLVDRDGLMALRKDRSQEGTGFTKYVTLEDGNGLSPPDVVEVYVLWGMPRADAIATMAHELTHAWLAMLGRDQAGDALNEGSCNYAALLVLAGYPGPEAEFVGRRLLGSKDPVYGEGLRRVRRYAEEKGMPAWIDLMRAGRVLPPAY